MCIKRAIGSRRLGESDVDLPGGGGGHTLLDSIQPSIESVIIDTGHLLIHMCPAPLQEREGCGLELGGLTVTSLSAMER